MTKGKDKKILQRIYMLIVAGCTIRTIADALDTTHSTIHNWIHKYMKYYLGEDEYLIVTDILDFNFTDKARRGAEATKQHWKEIKAKMEYVDTDNISSKPNSIKKLYRR